jgi:hypothetical protein
MRTLAIHVRPRRHEGRPSDIASLLSANSTYAPWTHDLARQVESGMGDHTMDQPPLPTVVEVHHEEQSTSRSRSAEPHHQTKTFAELQLVLIQNELVGAAADRARVHAERGEPDAVTRFRESGSGADRESSGTYERMAAHPTGAVALRRFQSTRSL